MKILYIFILTAFLSSTVFSQSNTDDDSEIKTIFGDKEFSSSGYGCPEIKFTQFLDQTAIMVGGRGGWIVNHVFSIGGAGYGLVTSPEVEGYKPLDITDTIPYYLRTGWGGLFLQYTYSSNSIIHFTINSLIGAGGVSATPSLRTMDHNSNLNSNDYEMSAFFIFEPGIGVELNMLKFFRIEVSGSYRIIAGMDMPQIEQSKFSSPSINLAFKFGTF